MIESVTARPLRLLILGRGKTGSLVAQVAHGRGHSVTVLGSDATTTFITQQARAADAAIDFTTPDAVLLNLRALLETGTGVVVGTTGWYASLDAVTALAHEHAAGLLYGTNFSMGVQAFFRAGRDLAAALPGYTMQIDETHHVTKKDAPSGTALTLQQAVERASGGSAPIESHRVGDAAGLHVLSLHSPEETLTLRHEASSRKAFAVGAVRAAEWLAEQPPGVWDFADIAAQL